MAGSAPAPPPPLDLLPMSGFRNAFAGFQLVNLIAALLVPLVSLGLWVASFVCLLIWTYLAVENVRRVKPAAPYATPPRPGRAVIWWFMPVVVLVTGGMLFAIADRSVDQASFDGRDAAELVRGLVVVVTIVAAIGFTYKPYSYLASATAWAGGDGGRMKRWFWYPIVTWLVLAVAAVAVTIGVGGGPSTDEVTVAEGGAAALVILAVPLGSYMVWLLMGLRAMTELETAVRHTALRRREETMDPNLWAAQYVIRAPGPGR